MNKPATTQLCIAGLDAGYRTRRVLQGLSLRPLESGQLVALVGANAAGKSTLLRTLAGQLRPQAGSMHLDDKDLARLDASTRNRLVGYLPQSLPLGSSLYAWEAVMAACRAGGGAASQAEADARCEQVFARLGLQALALRRLSELSGGQRQMVGLAQLLVRRPRLLLLDEPTSALDPRWQLEVLGAVREEAHMRQAIALIALHDLNLALRFCDRVVVLAEGHKLAEGTPHEAMTSQVLRDAYGIEGRVERCSLGSAIVLVDRALTHHHRETHDHP